MNKSLSRIHYIFLLLFAATSAVYAQINIEQNVKDGYVLLQGEKFEAAILVFNKVLNTEPENYQARIGLAIAFSGLDKLPEASREIAKLLVNNPQDTKLLEMSAQLFWLQKRFVEAEIVLKRRILLAPVRAETWALYGDVSDALKKPDEAISAYEKAVKIEPDSITFRYALGSLYWKKIRYDEAQREFLEILKRSPNEPRASFNLGDIYLSGGDAEKAIPFLETAAKSFPDEFDTAFALGRAYLSAGKYAAAANEFEKAAKIRSNIPELFYQLGLALQKGGQKSAAAAFFKKAKQMQDAQRQSESTPLNSKKKPN